VLSNDFFNKITTATHPKIDMRITDHTILWKNFYVYFFLEKIKTSKPQKREYFLE